MDEMTSENIVHYVVLLAREDDAVEPVHERVPATQIGVGRFRLLRSPGLVEGVAAGDEIEIDPREPLDFKVLRRSGNLSVWLFFDGPIEEHALRDLRKKVETLGGHLDGGTHGSHIFTISAAVGFAKIQQPFDDFCARYPVASWMFSNVYDPVDGKTFLNWWK